jgi:hypothetical protein
MNEYPHIDEKTIRAIETYKMYILNNLIKQEKLKYELTFQLVQLRESYLKEENNTKMK